MVVTGSGSAAGPAESTLARGQRGGKGSQKLVFRGRDHEPALAVATRRAAEATHYSSLSQHNEAADV